MVELARLERVYGRKVIQGSNPCLSAKFTLQTMHRIRSRRLKILLILLGVCVLLSSWGVAGWMLYKNHTDASKITTATTGASRTTSNTTQLDPAVYAGWASYTLKYDKLSFRYPSDWTVKLSDNENMSDFVQFAAPDGFNFSIQDGQGPPQGDFSTIDATEPVTFTGQADYIAYVGDASQQYGYPPSLVVSAVVVSNPADAESRPTDKNATSDDGFGGKFISILFSYDNSAQRALSGQTAPDDPGYQTAKLVIESMHY